MHRAAARLVQAAVCAAMVFSGAARAEFRSVGDRPAVLYDAPSPKANRVAILSRLQPVEVVVKLDKWTKVRDASGELAWVENALLTDARHVMITAAVAEVRTQPKATSPVAFEAQKQVVLERTGSAQDGWFPVRHRDGAQGYIATSQVWGE
jgi:SH3-like domain-containing protein